MCDCLEKTEENLIKHLTERLGKDTTIQDVNIDESGYVNKGLSLGAGWKLFLPYAFKYTPTKKDGSAGKEKTFKTSIFPTFCPFCGLRFEKKEELFPVQNETENG